MDAVNADDKGVAEEFQPRVGFWLVACFGDAIADDTVGRNHRFLEESLELVQACESCHGIVDGKPKPCPKCDENEKTLQAIAEHVDWAFIGDLDDVVASRINERNAAISHFAAERDELQAKVAELEKKWLEEQALNLAEEADYEVMSQQLANAESMAGLDAEMNRELRAKVEELTSEVAQWKNNHATVVRQARTLKERTDMPLERVHAYEHYGMLLARVAELEEALTPKPLREGLVHHAFMLEPTHNNAEFWQKAGHAESDPRKALMCIDQAVNAWKNAAYAMAERVLALEGKDIPYAATPEQIGAGIAGACRKGKWSLVSPDGQSWIGSEPPIIATIILASMGGSLPKENSDGT